MRNNTVNRLDAPWGDRAPAKAGSPPRIPSIWHRNRRAKGVPGGGSCRRRRVGPIGWQET